MARGYVHFHTKILDGVFHREPSGQLAFHPLPPPTEEQLARLLASIHRRVVRLLQRRGLCLELSAGSTDEAPEQDEPALAGLLQASVRNVRSAGPRAGTSVLRVGRDPKAPWVTSRGGRQAQLDDPSASREIFDVTSDDGLTLTTHFSLIGVSNCTKGDSWRRQ